MIKNGPGFMVSQMHSLFKQCGKRVDINLTYEIANKFFHVTNYMASRPNIEIMSLTYTPPRCEINLTLVIKITSEYSFKIYDMKLK